MGTSTVWSTVRNCTRPSIPSTTCGVRTTTFCSALSGCTCWAHSSSVDKVALQGDGLGHLHDFYPKQRYWHIEELHDRLRDALMGYWHIDSNVLLDRDALLKEEMYHIAHLFHILWHWYISTMFVVVCLNTKHASLHASRALSATEKRVFRQPRARKILRNPCAKAQLPTRLSRNKAPGHHLMQNMAWASRGRALLVRRGPRLRGDTDLTFNLARKLLGTHSFRWGSLCVSPSLAAIPGVRQSVSAMLCEGPSDTDVNEVFIAHCRARTGFHPWRLRALVQLARLAYTSADEDAALERGPMGKHLTTWSTILESTQLSIAVLV